MNPKVIDVELTVVDEVDILNFKLDDSEPYKYIVNLNNAKSQNNIKNVFCKLLELLLDSGIELNLVVAEGYSKLLYRDVSAEYILDLNRELAQVKEQLIQELR